MSVITNFSLPHIVGSLYPENISAPLEMFCATKVPPQLRRPRAATDAIEMGIYFSFGNPVGILWGFSGNSKEFCKIGMELKFSSHGNTVDYHIVVEGKWNDHFLYWYLFTFLQFVTIWSFILVFMM